MQETFPSDLSDEKCGLRATPISFCLSLSLFCARPLSLALSFYSADEVVVREVRTRECFCIGIRGPCETSQKVRQNIVALLLCARERDDKKKRAREKEEGKRGRGGVLSQAEYNERERQSSRACLRRRRSEYRFTRERKMRVERRPHTHTHIYVRAYA